MSRSILFVIVLLASPVAAHTQQPAERSTQAQTERERKEEERRRKAEEKEAQRQAGVRCTRLRGKKRQ